MKNKRKVELLITSLLILGFSHISFCQDMVEEDIKALLRHRVSLMMGHTHIPSGESEGEKKFMAVPSWGLDYNFQISRKWAVGIHSDIITESFTVIDFEGNEEFERERPLTMTLVGVFKPHERWSFLAGAGYEFAAEENLSLLRLGIERGWEMQKDWEVFVTAQYDLRLSVYDTFMLGVGFSKGF
ncbi:hypothetical protein [Cognataquiflexum rubidum]|uniref:hypothetical protein n=1 Tax=Cognataquiflexum rubidum TaxID=2922273 RepID=UPI001F128DBD|nr:hypothetical protein [Cognataquiflexum rubidum]MCH6234398.1 hypothetical protein [Cognataquiflexum rubidum]